MNSPRPIVSIVIATHNRCDVLCHTLTRLADISLDRKDYEIIVVDNASTDATRRAIKNRADLVIPLRRNVGSCAKAFGASEARGTFVLFLDDDSYPHADSVPRMMEHFHADPRLAAAGFTVHLPNGKQEASALPGVFVGCGVGLQAQALREVGGLDASFFMQAEEFDLAFRLAGAGWSSAIFDDLHVEHLKTVQARRSDLTTYFDMRNNLRVAARYLPAPYARIYAQDWQQRYAWLAQRDGLQRAYRRGLRDGWWRAALERRTFASRRLTPLALEPFFSWNSLREKMAALSARGVRRIAIISFGKNIYAFCDAARHARIECIAIGDDRFAFPNRRYRGTPVVGLSQALGAAVDALVIGQTAAVHARSARQEIQGRTRLPIYDWFGMSESTIRAPGTSIDTLQSADVVAGAAHPGERHGEPVLATASR